MLVVHCLTSWQHPHKLINTNKTANSGSQNRSMNLLLVINHMEYLGLLAVFMVSLGSNNNRDK
jgi:hypothetical protein